MTRESSDVRERREDCIRALRERDMLAAEFCPTESDRDWHVHAAQAAAETEFNNLATQLVRSENFANELRSKLATAQGKYQALTALLTKLEPSATAEKAPENDAPQPPPT